ncbi:TPA: hypothetical protein DCR49_00455 [Candidatus Delongbacteria bacterium]|nr:MAG: hypothetical protein A2Y39_00445 [Candidatus Delongbacteria bacterium GWF2_40_14]HAQ60469.1 hypothetical protein [Candidatus Delongbacteria bacterium]
MPEEINRSEEIKQVPKAVPVENIKKSYIDDEDENPTIIEKFMRLEIETKTGLIISLTFLLALIFRWHWFNTRWWLILILAVIGLKSLYTQMNDLVDEKPSEAKLARYSFIGLIALLVIRDIYITVELADLLSLISLR